MEIVDQETEATDAPGTLIRVEHTDSAVPSVDFVRSALGTRFLADPNFAVEVNGVYVELDTLPVSHAEHRTITTEHGDLEVFVVDSKVSDRTTNHHGIAWRVNRRLVGEQSWRWLGDDAYIDGRTSEAKRFGIIVTADHLEPAVRSDWSDFDWKNPLFENANEKYPISFPNTSPHQTPSAGSPPTSALSPRMS